MRVPEDSVNSGEAAPRLSSTNFSLQGFPEASKLCKQLVDKSTTDKKQRLWPKRTGP